MQGKCPPPQLGRWRNAEICGSSAESGEIFGVVTFDLVNDGAIQLGIRSCQVLQIPVGWYAVRLIYWYALSMVCSWYAVRLR